MSTTTTTRTTIFSSKDGALTLSELERLESLYLATMRRKMGPELFFSSGVGGVYSVVAYSEKGQEGDVLWLTSNVKESRA